MIDIFMIADLVGSVAFALSGFFVGVRKQLDYMGLFIVSLMTASGGGMLRDVLVGRIPLLLSDMTAFIVVTYVIIVATLFKLYRDKNINASTWFVVSDSIGLCAFAVTGTLVAIDVGLPVYGGIVLAILTATGGGVLRDILVNEMPSLLKSDFYGMVALIIAALIYGLHALELFNDYTIGVVFVVALAIRMIAFHYKWQLPRVKV